MSELFGNSVTTGDYFNIGVQLIYTQAYACPGTGSRTVEYIEIYVKSGGGTPGNIRLAIYDSDLALVCQWSAQILIDSTSAAWIGSVQGLSGTTTLTGGNNYFLACTADSDDSQTPRDTGTLYYQSGDYTGGFPASISAGTSYPQLPPIRVALADASNYSREANAVLPGTDADLAIIYTAADKIAVSTLDGTTVGAHGDSGQNVLHEYKDNATGKDAILLTWTGMTNIAPSIATVYLQIYNRTTTTWDPVTSNNSAGYNTNFTLTKIVNVSANYKDGSGNVSCRIYQVAP